MPYEWHNTDNGAPDISGASSSYAAEGAPLAHLSLWPYRSLPRRGFVWFIGGTAALISVPLLAVIGSPILWGLLPFLALAVAAMWYFLERSYRDGSLVEEVEIWSDRMELTRHEPRGGDKHWVANPYWVRLSLHPRGGKGGTIRNYLTMKGEGREVELGAFLSEEERLRLHDELQQVLAKLPH